MKSYNINELKKKNKFNKPCKKKINMKHFTTIICAAIMLFGMTACAQNP